MQYIDPSRLNPTLPQPGNVYAGGSPNFDETTGRSLSNSNYYTQNPGTQQTNPDGRPLYQPMDSIGGGNTGLMAGAAPVLPNYQANNTIPNGWGGPVLNKLEHPGVLEDVSRGAFGGNFLQPKVVADLNSRVASGAMTQDQANAQWAQMREAEAEAARGRETSGRLFDQHGIAAIGSAALGTGIAGFLPAARGATSNPGSVTTPGGGMNFGSTDGGGTPGFPGMTPGMLGGGLQLAGSNEALKSYEEAQRQAEAAGKFQPYNVFSGTGSTTFGPGGATSSLSPQYQGLRDQYLGNANAGAAAAGAFDPSQASDNLYKQLQAQAAPGEAEQRSSAIAQLQGTGTLGLGVGADTGAGPANPLYSSLLKAQADAGRQRQISAYGMAQDTANQMQQRALGWGGAGLTLDQSQLPQLQTGGYLGGLQSNSALGGARLAQGPILGQGLTKGGFLSGAGGALTGPGGSVGGTAAAYLQRLLSGGGGIPGLPGAPPNFSGTGVDASGNPTGGNFSGGDPSQYNDLGGNWDPNTGLPYASGGMSSFDPNTDWMNLYG